MEQDYVSCPGGKMLRVLGGSRGTETPRRGKFAVEEQRALELYGSEHIGKDIHFRSLAEVGVCAKNTGRWIKYATLGRGIVGLDQGRSPTMPAIAKTTTTATEMEQLKTRLKATWMTGDYDTFSRYMEKDAEVFYRRLNVKPGARLLDVGCGAGQIALIAARAGAQATGCDIATNWIEKARVRAAAEGLKATFEEGDAEALPYRDGQFDVVTSLVGAMFAPRPDLVAPELTRVCRPGGMIAMANWTPGGFIGQMFKTIGKHIAPSGMPSPVLWGDEATVRERLRDGIADLQLSRHIYRFFYPFAPDAVVEFFRVHYGPMTKAFASLDGAGQEKLRNELVELWSSQNKAVDGTTLVEAEYLQVVATKKSS
jgi:2-polyprenyl-3-methyl-5-hydroxy-6-metoxy-1,4-benzoquinol methylase